MPVHHDLSLSAFLLRMWPYLLLIICLFGGLAYNVWLDVSGWSGWLVWSEGRRMHFRKPKFYRYTGSLGVVAMGLVLLSNLWMNFPPLLHFVSFALALCAFGWAASLFGPNETWLDGERWMYETVEGCPWKPKTRRGSLDEFAGVCVTSGGRGQRCVMLLPKPPKNTATPRIILDMPMDPASMATRISQTTGLPIVLYPG